MTRFGPADDLVWVIGPRETPGVVRRRRDPRESTVTGGIETSHPRAASVSRQH